MRLCYCFYCIKPQAQTTHIKSVPLNNTVPNVALNMVFYNSTTARLSDFKDKLLILDFWSTICSSCIHHFDELDALQQQYASSIFILPVSSLATGDNKQTVTHFITGYRQRIKGGFHFPSVVNDKVLDKYFPHSTIPHFVWINKGVYVGATSAEQLTEENIQKVLSGGGLKTEQKEKKEFYDVTKTLASYVDNDTKNILSSSLLTNNITTLESSMGLTRNAFTGCKITAVNISALGLYKFAFMHAAYLPNNRIVKKLSAENPFAALLNNNSNDDSLYCYQFVANGLSDSLMFCHMQQNLTAYFRIQAYTEKRKMRCIVYVSADSSKLKTSGGIEGNSLYENITGERVIINQPLSVLVERLNDILPEPVLDETGFTKY